MSSRNHHPGDSRPGPSRDPPKTHRHRSRSIEAQNGYRSRANDTQSRYRSSPIRTHSYSRSHPHYHPYETQSRHRPYRSGPIQAHDRYGSRPIRARSPYRSRPIEVQTHHRSSPIRTHSYYRSRPYEPENRHGSRSIRADSPHRSRPREAETRSRPSPNKDSVMDRRAVFRHSRNAHVDSRLLSSPDTSKSHEKDRFMSKIDRLQSMKRAMERKERQESQEKYPLFNGQSVTETKKRIGLDTMKMEDPPVAVPAPVVSEMEEVVRMDVKMEVEDVRMEVEDVRMFDERVRMEMEDMRMELEDARMEAVDAWKDDKVARLSMRALEEWERLHHDQYSSCTVSPPTRNAKAPSGAHPMELSNGGYYIRLYKVAHDSHIPSTLKSKDFVRRYNGRCGDKYKQFDYPQAPKDPRVQYRRIEQPKDLKVPNLALDDQYIGIPPKREVTISNLNDNVNEKFLRDKINTFKLVAQEVIVFYHPVTKKHLTMAFILFDNSKSARIFVGEMDGVKVMGSNIHCILDPFAAELSGMYSAVVQQPLPPLKYLSGMSEHELSLRRETLTGTTAAPKEADEAVAAAVASIDAVEKERSLTPMDMDTSPPVDETAPPPPPLIATQPWQQPPLQAVLDDADACASKMASPPPPYSKLPPSYHGEAEEIRPEEPRFARWHIVPEGPTWKPTVEEIERRSRREKRRHHMTSSSDSDSSPGEGHSNGSKRRSDSGVKKKEEYVKVKRIVSSERDSNGDKRIVKEVKTVTYTRRTEQRIGKKTASPDSFDEEMKRREREGRSTSSSKKRTSGKDEMRWSTPSSDSDNGRGGGSRRKRAKDRTTESHSKEEEGREGRPPPPADPHPTTPSTALSSTRRSGFHSAPRFDPTQPPPTIVVPPVGLVMPAATIDCSLPPPPPLATIPLPAMVLPPPPLPGGFIPPPEFFGMQSTPAMLSAVTAAAAGLVPPPPGLPPPPMMMPIGGYGSTPLYAATPTYTPHTTPVRPVKTPYKQPHEDAAASVVSSPSTGLVRAASGASLSAAGRTPADEKATATPPTQSDGGNTPSAAHPTAEKKANLDDRLSQIFGLTTSKKDKEATEIKHVACAPSMSTVGVESKKTRDDDDMEIEDDDMDVASSSSGEERGRSMNVAEKRGGAEGRETMQLESVKDSVTADADRMMKEEAVAQITQITLDKLIRDFHQQVVKDLTRKCETAGYQVLEDYEKKQKSEEDEKRKQMVRDAMAKSAKSGEITAKKDTMEEMLAAKLMSPEGLAGGGRISNLFSSINIVKRKVLAVNFSRDGTPVSRDSRGHSRTKSRSRSRSRSTSSNEGRRRPKKRRTVSSSSTSSWSSDSQEEAAKERARKRPNMRNIESSHDSSSFSSDSQDEEKENQRNDDDMGMMDMTGVDGFEGEQAALKEDSAADGASWPEEPSTSLAAAAAVKKVKEVERGEGGEASSSVVPSPSTATNRPSSWSSSTFTPASAARIAAQQELLQQQPSMRPDESGYDPVRYDHPYVRQLGVPFNAARTMVPVSVRDMAEFHVDAVAAKQRADDVAAGRIVPKAKTAKGKKKAETAKVSTEVRSPVDPPVPKKRVEIRRRPPVIFPKRSEDEENFVLGYFKKAGVDREDEEFMQLSLAELQKDGARPFGVDFEIGWETQVAYIPTPRELEIPHGLNGRLDHYFDDVELAGVVPHSTGCARAQGFYRLPNKIKARVIRRPQDPFENKTEICERDEIVKRHQLQAVKEQRSTNRRLMTMVDAHSSDFFKTNNLKYRRKMIKFARSRIHGWGLYALEPIAPDDMIVEYIGQKIRPSVAEEREKRYERRGIGSSYLFRIDEDEVIDATKEGNFARFINHSCQPNCYAKIMTVEGDKRIVIYSKVLIRKGDEITYDYKFPLEDTKIACLCGAPQCRGSLN